jgi:1-acyl-sn-glycerol-3-phosphate acyltransferase
MNSKNQVTEMVYPSEENEEFDRNRFRPYSRLLSVAGITSTKILQCLTMRPFSRNREIHGNNILHQWASWLTNSIGIKVEVTGTIPEYGSLLVSNHRSYMDIIAIGKYLPVTFLAKDEISRWPLIGYGCKVTNVVFVKREDGESRKASRKQISGLLEKGISIAVFPEGTSYEGPGILPFRQGVFDIAARNNFPVVPVAIEYCDPSDAWVGDDTFQRHFFDSFEKKNITIHLSFGEMHSSSNAESLREDTWNWINNKVIESRNNFRMKT